MPDTPGGVAQLAIPELPFPRGIEPIDPKAEILDSFAPPNLQAEGAPTVGTPISPRTMLIDYRPRET